MTPRELAAALRILSGATPPFARDDFDALTRRFPDISKESPHG